MSFTEIELDRLLIAVVSVARAESLRLERADVTAAALGPLSEEELEELVSRMTGAAPGAGVGSYAPPAGELQPAARVAVTVPDLDDWVLAGTSPALYEVDDERTAGASEKRAAKARWLRSRSAPQDGPGSTSSYLRTILDRGVELGVLMAQADPANARGRRLCMSARVKAENVTDRAGLWLRVTDPLGSILEYDDMQDRPIRGTKDWQTYEVVVEMPPEASALAFGVALAGAGQVWIEDVSLHVVSDSVTTTAPPCYGRFAAHWSQTDRKALRLLRG